MHIGYLTFESPYSTRGGGVAAYLRAMIPAVIGAGHRVTLISARHPLDFPNPYPEALRIIAVTLPQSHWYSSKLPVLRDLVTLPLREIEWSVKFRRVVAKAMQEDPMDVLETTELGGWSVAKSGLVPLAIRLHGSEHTARSYRGEPISFGCQWNRNLQRTAFQHAAVVTAPSRFQAELVAQEMNWPQERILAVPNGIARDFAGSQEGARPDESHPMIVYTARLTPVKGILTLLETAREVLKEFPNAEFVIAGLWQMREPDSQWQIWLQRYGLSDRVRWVGRRDGEGLKDLYRKATIFFAPSYYETFCIAAAEAMAFRVPVVSSTAGALPELITDGVTGLTAPAGDVTGFAASICRLLRDSQLRRSLGAAGRERVLADFTTDTVVHQAIRVYQQAASQSRSSGDYRFREARVS